MSKEELTDEEKDQGGRPEHVPTDETRRKVQALAEAGVKQISIAHAIGIGSKDTLRKHYGKELMLGDANVQALIGQALVRVALGHPAEYDQARNLIRAEKEPNVATLIFLGKTRLGLVERLVVNDKEDEKNANDLEFGTAGISNAERVSRINGILNAARARGVRRTDESRRPVGAVSGQPAGSGDKKRG